MVKVVKSRSAERTRNNPNLCDWTPFDERHVGRIGYVSIKGETMYMVSFIKRGERTTCGFFFDDEIEVIKRGAF